MRLRLLAVLLLLVSVAPVASSRASESRASEEPAPPPDACVETPRPDASLPVLEAQRRSFGFHDEELRLCSPGASRARGGSPTSLSARLWVPATCPPVGGCAGVVIAHGFGANKELTFADMQNLVLRGLHVLSYDVRGQGQSGGQSGLMGPNEIADQAHVLRWFHEHVRPRRTGVYGISQGGAHALMAAIYNCGSRRAASLDLSVPCDAGRRWVHAIVPVQAPTAPEPDGTCLTFLVGAIAQSRAHPAISATSLRCGVVGGPAESAGLQAMEPLPSIDPTWIHYRSRADRIDVPAYLATSFNDRLVLPQHVTRMYELLRARPDHHEDLRLLITNDGHGSIGANLAALDDLFTWLERQLKGDPRPLRAAPVAMEQEWADDAFRLESAWPIPGTTRTSWPLPVGDGADVRNLPVLASAPDSVPLVGDAVAVRTIGLVPGDSAVFDLPVRRAVEVTGLPVARLRISSSGRSAQVHVGLSEVEADGTATEFARNRRGYTDLSGEPRDVSIPLTVSSRRLPAGSRLRVTITASDVGKVLPAADPAGFTIHAGDVVVPAVDPKRPTVPGPVPEGAAFFNDPVATICTALRLPC